ncbi:MAG: response regulator [Anaerolineae bacterium]|nr:response regulator [Anaerolineae bacterium]
MSARILVVDDERQLAYYLRQTLLLELPGTEVDAAHSGEEALSRMAEASYDLIIADLRMPGFSGLELIKGVRYLDETVPIILMTGYGSSGLREKAARLGATSYLDKPFDVGKMIEAVRSLLPKGEGTDG